MDGVITVDAPLVRAATSLRFNETPTKLEVFVRRGATQSFEQQPVAVTNQKIGALPAGSWDYLLAMTRYAGGSAMYAWRLR